MRVTILACFLGVVGGSANILASIQSPLEGFSVYILACPYLGQAERVPRGGAYSSSLPLILSMELPEKQAF